MSIPPETKDWTWVLSERCEECGFDSSAPVRDDLVSLTRTVGNRWATGLAAQQDPGRRPDPIVWSPLEYACHVRDVFALATYRTKLMIDEDQPQFANWDQDATAVEDDYGSQNVVEVRDQIAANVAEFADYLSTLSASAWTRTGTRSDGAGFTVESFTRYVLHDPIHHLTDITGQKWS